MAVMNLLSMEFIQEPTQKNDIVFRVPFINGGHPSAIRPMENLSTRYYGGAALISWQPSQALPIGRTNPPVKSAITLVTLNKTGMGSTYRISDEALRQYSLGTYLHRAQTSYYQTRP